MRTCPACGDRAKVFIAFSTVKVWACKLCARLTEFKFTSAVEEWRRINDG